MTKYIVAIVGFNNVNKAISAIDDMMKEQGIWLFTIVGGNDGIGKEVAARIGAPYQYVKSLKELMYYSNYIIADVSAGQEVKNFIMQAKSAGKHGKVIK